MIVDLCRRRDRLANRQLRRPDDGEVGVVAHPAASVGVDSRVGNSLAIVTDVAGDELESHRRVRCDRAAPGKLIVTHTSFVRPPALNPTGEINLARQGVCQQHAGRIRVAFVLQQDGVGHQPMVVDLCSRCDRLANRQLRRPDDGEVGVVAHPAASVAVDSRVGNSLAIVPHVSGDECEGLGHTRGDSPAPDELVIVNGRIARLSAWNPFNEIHLRG